MRVHASLFYLGFTVALCGCRATPPGKWETAATFRIKHSITVRGKAAKNPLPETPENIKDGQTALNLAKEWSEDNATIELLQQAVKKKRSEPNQ